MRIDTIPPKIIKMLNDNNFNNIEFIANSMITQSLFPDQAKISITPVFSPILDGVFGHPILDGGGKKAPHFNFE